MPTVFKVPKFQIFKIEKKNRFCTNRVVKIGPQIDRKNKQRTFFGSVLCFRTEHGVFDHA